MRARGKGNNLRDRQTDRQEGTHRHDDRETDRQRQRQREKETEVRIVSLMMAWVNVRLNAMGNTPGRPAESKPKQLKRVIHLFTLPSSESAG